MRGNFCYLAAALTIVGLLVFEVTMPACEAGSGGDEIPRAEHPRPDFQRASWINLNGTWRFLFDPEDIGERARWFEGGDNRFTRTIIVPFPWESELSGINDKEYSGAAWYRRQFVVPQEWDGKKVFLKFGAVDWEAKVWLNGQYVGGHEGGYSPFELDITETARFGSPNVLTVRAFDVTHPELPSGKQTGWYTTTSGIWQTVYVEAHGTPYLKLTHITPDIDKKQARLELVLESAEPVAACEIAVTVTEPQQLRAKQTVSLEPGENRVSLVLDVPEPQLWEPDSPTLYMTEVTLRSAGDVSDRVQTYFGMRKVSVGKWGDNDFTYIYLNNRPIYLLGALHQSFNPEGIYTHPSDGFIQRDMEETRRLGLNFLRIHIKVEEPRALYWADRSGVMLMCDMPNFSKHTARARQAWEQTLRDAVARDYNHPSIIAWCDFNETWGLDGRKYSRNKGHQEWVREMYLLTKRLDPTRLVEENSPCLYDHVATDINSWHFYIDSYDDARKHIEHVVANTYPGSQFNYVRGEKQGEEPLINSEYGGVSAGGGDRDISWCFKHLTTLLRRHPKIGGYIYTELSDIEWEHNGFMNYDRSDKEYGYEEMLPGFDLACLNNLDFIVIDAPPYSETQPRGNWRTKLFLSHFSDLSPRKLVLKWQFTGVDSFGSYHTYVQGQQDVTWEPYAVVELPEFEIQLPGEPALGTLGFRLEDESGNMITANYVNINVIKDVPRIEKLDDRTWAVRFQPDEAVDGRWDTMEVSPEHAAEKVFGTGVGFFEYAVRVPEEIDVGTISEMTLLAELGSKATTEKRDWPERVKPIDYPQTDGTKWPTQVTVRFQDVEVAKVMLPDDPADARGVLSHAAAYHHGSYGYLQKVTVAGDALDDIRASLATNRVLKIRLSVEPTAEHKGGLAVYGDRMGRYPMNPTLLIRTGESSG